MIEKRREKERYIANVKASTHESTPKSIIHKKPSKRTHERDKKTAKGLCSVIFKKTWVMSHKFENTITDHLS